MTTDTTEENAYIATLEQIKGIGQQSVLRIINAFPSIKLLQQASPPQLEEKLGKRPATSLRPYLERWGYFYEAVLEKLESSARQGIIAIPITSEAYPPLLKLIDDPPPILYAKGDISLLKHFHAVAIVGTREPTMRGREIAYAFARRWASYDYAVVSGLAKGIDTAAHQGALDAHGKTIAVLGTSLDKIYPAENKGLAQHIVESGGLILSELMVGQAGFKTAFVERDRLQSGLSLCVFPVQTTIDGGTMHTVRFAEKQRRYVICLRPDPEEASARQYEGIWHLMHEGKRVLDPTREDHFESCLQVFPLLLKKLLSTPKDHPQGGRGTTRPPGAGEQTSDAGLWNGLDGAVSRRKSPMDAARDEKQIKRALEALGIDSQTERFKTEAYHLSTLFSQGQTIAQVLETVSDTELRQELTPFMYGVHLSTLVIAARELHMLSPEQAEDFQAFLKRMAGLENP